MALKRRVVVIGLGSIGRRHTRLLLERDDVTVEVCEPNAVALAACQREVGRTLPSYPNFDSALTAAPDVIWITSPTDLHADQAVAALQSGCHVFCEKPMSDTLAGGLRMKEAADRTDRVLNVGFYLHFWTGFQAVRNMVRSGDLGVPIHAHAWIGTYVTLLNSGSRYQARCPGSLFFDYSHQPDLFSWIFGQRPRRVHAIARQVGALELTSDPNVAVLVCEHASKLLATILLNYVQMPDRHYYEFVGDEGWVSLDFNTKVMQTGNRRTQTVRTVTYKMERDDMFRAEHAAFFDAVSDKREPETPPAEGLVATAVCEAAVESWRTGCPAPVRI